MTEDAVAIPPAAAPVAAVPAVRPEILAIPLGARRLVATSLDLLTRPDSGLRSASFYLGFLLLVTVGPAAMLLAAIWLTVGPGALEAGVLPETTGTWFGFAAILAAFGYLAATVEATGVAVAVIGGRAEGRPLALAESIAIVRRRFWRLLVVQAVVALLSGVGQSVAERMTGGVVGPTGGLDVAVQLVAGLAVTLPFVYAPAGIVLGEVGAYQALRRSVALVRARPALAVVVGVFGIASQLVILFGIGAGADILVRGLEGIGATASMPPEAGVLVAATLVFALGTLVFLVAAIPAAPQVHAFEALTHYTHGLELGRARPLRVRWPWDPFVSRPLAVAALVGAVAVYSGLVSLNP